MTHRNPFEYVGANDLSSDTIADYYIEDFNYSRFIQSTRNILLVGERGCGKSMTLLYNSLPVQQLLASRRSLPLSFDLMGVYVPCNTPLSHKREFQLLDGFRASVISEHLFVLSIAYSIADTLSHVPDILTPTEDASLRQQFAYLIGGDIPNTGSVLDAIKQYVERECIRAQRAANSRSSTDVFFEDTYSFASLIVPLVRSLRGVEKMKTSHFAFLIDDAHDLNEYQRRSLFSWIAYRDHSQFSFKVAVASVTQSSLATAAGGSILEGHDYTRIDMAAPIHNEESDFGRLAAMLISRRLVKAGIDATPEDFFPISPQMVASLEESERHVRKEAEEKYGGDSRRISDYVYKYKRAHFFRSRPATANRAEYSGFDTLVFLSTGVIRNLLIPCYWMFDKVRSLASEGAGNFDSGGNAPSDAAQEMVIPPKVQSEVILDRSRRLWDWLEKELDKSIENCSRDTAKRAFQLLDNLAVLFRERLLKHKSEPRATSFTISSADESTMDKLNPVLEVLVAAQLLYVRSGPAKEKGRRESYFVPNRMLWPARGLDPHGQHARVSLPAVELWHAADLNKPIPFSDSDEATSKQPRLFDVD